MGWHTESDSTVNMSIVFLECSAERFLVLKVGVQECRKQALIDAFLCASVGERRDPAGGPEGRDLSNFWTFACQKCQLSQGCGPLEVVTVVALEPSCVITSCQKCVFGVGILVAFWLWHLGRVSKVPTVTGLRALGVASL